MPTPRATDWTKGGQRGSHGDLTLPSAAVQVTALPTPTAADQRGPVGHGTGGADQRTTNAGPPTRPGRPDHTRWAAYAPAIAGWELLLGRPVPAPTQTGRHGRPVLAPTFVEWLQGLPEHWVTGLGLPRTVALRLLGNGVVPQQATAALRALLLIHAKHQAATP